MPKKIKLEEHQKDKAKLEAKAPEGYFDAFPKRMMMRIDEEKSGQRQWAPVFRLAPTYKVYLAAAILTGLALGLWMFWPNDFEADTLANGHEEELRVLEMELYLDYLEAEAWEELDEYILLAHEPLDAREDTWLWEWLEADWHYDAFEEY